MSMTPYILCRLREIDTVVNMALHKECLLKFNEIKFLENDNYAISSQYSEVAFLYRDLLGE